MTLLGFSLSLASVECPAMAKRSVKVSLATKLRILFGIAVIAIIAAALVIPWYFMELLAEHGVQVSAAELTQLRLNEFVLDHVESNKASKSRVAVLHMLMVGDGDEGRAGPAFIALRPHPPADGALDSVATDALRTFRHNPEQELVSQKWEDDLGRSVYRCFRAVRAGSTCVGCHSGGDKLHLQSGELVGMIDVTVPAAAAAGRPLVWWTRGAFILGGVLAAVFALVVFAAITQRLILRPLRELRDLSDKVADGNLSVRSTIRTGDELQRLGDSFNDMLSAIDEQHGKLRLANRALDLRLHELAEANSALFNANKVKSEFLANVSHELRTPLNSVIGFGDLVAESPDARVARYGQNILSAAKSLLSMINDLLDLAKIEAGKAEVRNDKVSVIDACQTLLSLIKPLADKRQLEVVSALPDNIPLITTDPGKVQQILYNLLSNAVKFTPPGGIVTLKVWRAAHVRQGQNVEEICISVADTGPGIDEAHQQHIFEKFYQADRTLTRESGGTGLGLSISKELTTLLGGRLTFDSKPGQGTVFTLSLPIHPDTATPAAPAQKSDVAKA